MPNQQEQQPQGPSTRPVLQSEIIPEEGRELKSDENFNVSNQLVTETETEKEREEPLPSFTSFTTLNDDSLNRLITSGITKLTKITTNELEETYPTPSHSSIYYTTDRNTSNTTNTNKNITTTSSIIGGRRKPLPKLFEGLSAEDRAYFDSFTNISDISNSFQSFGGAGLSFQAASSVKLPGPTDRILDESSGSLKLDDSHSDNFEKESQAEKEKVKEKSEPVKFTVLEKEPTTIEQPTTSTTTSLLSPTPTTTTKLKFTPQVKDTPHPSSPLFVTPLRHSLVTSAHPPTKTNTSTAKRKLPSGSLPVTLTRKVSSPHPLPKRVRLDPLVTSPPSRSANLFTPFRSPRLIKQPVTTVTPSSKLGSTASVSSRAELVKSPTTISLPIRDALLPALSVQEGYLPGTCRPSELSPLGIDPTLWDITLENASRYRFPEQLDRESWGLPEAQASLYYRERDMSWVVNHYSQIVWKTACLVRNFPRALAHRWHPDRILTELEHRHRREKELKHQSIIKGIVEQTLPASQYFVGVVGNVTDETIWVTDGWYTIKCQLDPLLLRALEHRRLFLGQKLAICGASLKSPGPMPVLESASLVQLNISGNGTRRARWDARLGARPTPLFPIHVKNIHPDGAIIPFIEATIIRKYPIKFLCKVGETKVIRSLSEERARLSQVGVTSEDEEVTAFFSIRITDDGVNEVTLKRWNTNLDEYSSLVEGRRYQFLSLIPSKSKFPHPNHEIELAFTRYSKWEPLMTQKLSTLTRKITLVTEMSSLSAKSEVDLIVTYIGEYFNGYTFLDSSFRFLVISPPPHQKDSFIKLNPGTTYVLENVGVDIFFAKYGIQKATLGFHGQIKVTPTLPQKPICDQHTDWFQSSLAGAEKLLEDTLICTQRGIPPVPPEQLVVSQGKFVAWQWESDHYVTAQFQPETGPSLEVILSPSQWKSTLAQGLTGDRLKTFRDQLRKGGFIDPTQLRRPESLRYLQLQPSLLSRATHPYQLLDRLLAPPARFLPTPLPHPALPLVHQHHLRNLHAYFTRLVQRPRYQLDLGPLARYPLYPTRHPVEFVTLLPSPSAIPTTAPTPTQ